MLSHFIGAYEAKLCWVNNKIIATAKTPMYLDTILTTIKNSHTIYTSLFLTNCHVIDQKNCIKPMFNSNNKNPQTSISIINGQHTVKTICCRYKFTIHTSFISLKNLQLQSYLSYS